MWTDVVLVVVVAGVVGSDEKRNVVARVTGQVRIDSSEGCLTPRASDLFGDIAWPAVVRRNS